MNVGDKEESEAEISIGLKFFSVVFSFVNAFARVSSRSLEIFSLVKNPKKPVLIAQPTNSNMKLTRSFSGKFFTISAM